MTSQLKLICVLAHPDNESLDNDQSGKCLITDLCDYYKTVVKPH